MNSSTFGRWAGGRKRGVPPEGRHAPAVADRAGFRGEQGVDRLDPGRVIGLEVGVVERRLFVRVRGQVEQAAVGFDQGREHVAHIDQGFVHVPAWNRVRHTSASS